MKLIIRRGDQEALGRRDFLRGVPVAAVSAFGLVSAGREALNCLHNTTVLIDTLETDGQGNKKIFVADAYGVPDGEIKVNSKIVSMKPQDFQARQREIYSSFDEFESVNRQAALSIAGHYEKMRQSIESRAIGGIEEFEPLRRGENMANPVVFARVVQNLDKMRDFAKSRIAEYQNVYYGSSGEECISSPPTCDVIGDNITVLQSVEGKHTAFLDRGEEVLRNIYIAMEYKSKVAPAAPAPARSDENMRPANA